MKTKLREERKRNMKIRRPLLVGVLSLLVVVAGILVGGDYPAVAVVSIASSTTTPVPRSPCSSTPEA